MAEFNKETGSFCRILGQYLGVLLGVITVISIGFSVNHDAKWNSYVNNRFNLNYGTKETKLNARDYIDVGSQQEWIDLIQRPLTLETIGIVLTLISIVLKAAHLVASPFVATKGLPRGAFYSGAFLYMFGAFLEGSAAVLLITSIVVTDEASNHVMVLIHTPNSERWADSSGSLNPPESYEIDLFVNVHCDTTEYNWEAPKQCQLTYAKIFATVFCFLNALNGLVVAFIFFCSDNDLHRVSPTSLLSLGSRVPQAEQIPHFQVLQPSLEFSDFDLITLQKEQCSTSE